MGVTRLSNTHNPFQAKATNTPTMSTFGYSPKNGVGGGTVKSQYQASGQMQVQAASPVKGPKLHGVPQNNVL